MFWCLSGWQGAMLLNVEQQACLEGNDVQAPCLKQIYRESPQDFTEVTPERGGIALKIAPSRCAWEAQVQLILWNASVTGQIHQSRWFLGHSGVIIHIVEQRTHQIFFIQNAA